MGAGVQWGSVSEMQEEFQLLLVSVVAGWKGNQGNIAIGVYKGQIYLSRAQGQLSRGNMW